MAGVERSAREPARGPVGHLRRRRCETRDAQEGGRRGPRAGDRGAFAIAGDRAGGRRSGGGVDRGRADGARRAGGGDDREARRDAVRWSAKPGLASDGRARPADGARARGGGRGSPRDRRAERARRRDARRGVRCVRTGRPDSRGRCSTSTRRRRSTLRSRSLRRRALLRRRRREPSDHRVRRAAITWSR